MRRDLITSAIAVVVFTVLFGLAYPLVIDRRRPGRCSPDKADGSQIERDGKVVGSSLIGQDFTKRCRATATRAVPRVPDPRYFQSRPSVTGYNADATYFNNLGPNNARAVAAVQGQPAPPTWRSRAATTRA